MAVNSEAKEEYYIQGSLEKIHWKEPYSFKHDEL